MQLAWHLVENFSAQCLWRVDRSVIAACDFFLPAEPEYKVDTLARSVRMDCVTLIELSGRSRKEFSMPLTLYLSYDKMPFTADHDRSGNIAAISCSHLVFNGKTSVVRKKPFAQPVHNAVARGILIHTLSTWV